MRLGGSYAWVGEFRTALAGEATDGLQLLMDPERAWFAARRAVAGRRRHSRAAMAVDILAAAPLVCASSLAAGLGMAVNNAAVLLEGLCAAGFAVELTHRAKRRLFGLAALTPVREVAPPRRPAAIPLADPVTERARCPSEPSRLWNDGTSITARSSTGWSAGADDPARDSDAGRPRPGCDVAGTIAFQADQRERPGVVERRTVAVRSVTADRRVAAAWSVYRDEVSDNFRIIDPKSFFRFSPEQGRKGKTIART